ncbi:uncharacterized protein LOC122258715 [Penaeus japonicus]|uniref:uncharacterized protein LOC122258715 n=1 Tax=Penaeus japonicus TaxID=27405 RepID=UPI001C710490|nr:uncharacterized protein LOC122258715 [Penaeus japonicus]
MASQGTHPACLFLALTLLVTTAATMILCSAILTNHWEVITFEKAEVEAIAAKHNATHTLTWLWGGKVGMVSIKLHQPLKLRRQDVGSQAYMGSRSHSLRFRRQTTKSIYLVPMHGGIWTLCVGLSEYNQIYKQEQNAASEWPLKQLHRKSNIPESHKKCKNKDHHINAIRAQVSSEEDSSFTRNVAFLTFICSHLTYLFNVLLTLTNSDLSQSISYRLPTAIDNDPY